MSKRPQTPGSDFCFSNGLEARRLLSGMGFDFHESMKPTPPIYSRGGDFSFRSPPKNDYFFGQPQPFEHDTHDWNTGPEPFRISLSDRPPFPQGVTVLIIKTAEAEATQANNAPRVSIEPVGQSKPIATPSLPAYTPSVPSYIPPVVRPVNETALIRASAVTSFNADRSPQPTMPVVNTAARLDTSQKQSVVAENLPVLTPSATHAVHETPLAFVPPSSGEASPETKSVAITGVDSQSATSQANLTGSTQGQSQPALSPWESLAWWLGRRGHTVETNTLNLQPGVPHNKSEAGTQAGPQLMVNSAGLLPESNESPIQFLTEFVMPATDAHLLSETSVEDQSDIIQSSIDAILAELSPAEDFGLTMRSGLGSSVGLAVATAIAVEYIRHKRGDDAETANDAGSRRTELASHSFRPACEESETAV